MPTGHGHSIKDSTGKLTKILSTVYNLTQSPGILVFSDDVKGVKAGPLALL